MSDLTATNCGCDNGCNSGCGSGTNSLFNTGSCGCSIIWIILLLNIFCGNGCGQSSCGCNDNNNCLLILLLLLCCNGDCGLNFQSFLLSEVRAITYDTRLSSTYYFVSSFFLLEFSAVSFPYFSFLPFSCSDSLHLPHKMHCHLSQYAFSFSLHLFLQY